ncbi:hypothetical protein CHLNCDRAFT_58566 [Chlorella variabilis]|uniref:Purple acid phosphatase n=1 Tax=Chlorella variabilis TaxID=554065 RepID=E1ZL81_CHLVA|nr:hypothetical protein CHLNCDRAFT_58566 [Chlorella variabilis]EFN53514.1 hypothetical protein CHLNCDRAFT_58566 [Chlorella variabilis]|eukprot:XP_005845616.1 hypothetical protein CHLNCDRAFT_58566 [Chlorella variabilis]
MPHSALLSWLLLLLLCGARGCACHGGGGRHLRLSVQPNDTQISNDPGLDPAVTDFELDDPRVARTAVGWEPEGVHLTLWTRDSVLVSWQTGEPRVAPASSPPEPHDAAEVAGVVRYGEAPGRYTQTVSDGTDVTYAYAYDEAAGGMAYQSPILHHVLLKGLQAGQTYYYRVGGRHPNGTATPDGKEFSFAMPAAPPAQLRVGIIGDPGQTHNTSTTLQHLAASQPDVVLVLGDLSYADLYFSNDTSNAWSFPSPPSTQQLRWDSWARLFEPLLASVPAIYIGGNHEVEHQPNNATFAAFNARYPQPKASTAPRCFCGLPCHQPRPRQPRHRPPQGPSTINTTPNNASHYLNASNHLQFVNTSDYEVQGGYWSVQLPWMHVIALNNYLPHDPASQQYKWAAAELAAVDRTATPWLVVVMHGAPRTTYAPPWGGMFKELEEFMAHYEPLFYGAQVDLVLSGHVHSYERSLPLFNYSVDPCGPAYIVVGDGGNAEGPEQHFVDVDPPDWCTNTSLVKLPSYQPTMTGEPTLVFYPDGSYCPTSQPAYSAFREPSFGHGLLLVRDGGTADWSWQRNQEGEARVADRVTLLRGGGCPQAARQAGGRGGGGERHVAAAGGLPLAAGAAAGAAMQA